MVARLVSTMFGTLQENGIRGTSPAFSVRMKKCPRSCNGSLMRLLLIVERELSCLAQFSGTALSTHSLIRGCYTYVNIASHLTVHLGCGMTSINKTTAAMLISFRQVERPWVFFHPEMAMTMLKFPPTIIGQYAVQSYPLRHSMPPEIGRLLYRKYSGLSSVQLDHPSLEEKQEAVLLPSLSGGAEDGAIRGRERRAIAVDAAQHQTQN
jgi:hypothetical protein